MKMHQQCKNGQKSAKIGKNYEKIDFPYNNFPKKGISLRKCTKKKIAFGEKKIKKKIAPAARYTAATPRGAIEFLESSILGFCPYT